MKARISLIILALVTFAGAVADETRPLRPVNTYSIVARDATTGELGVAVQSHWFSVGSLVSWAEPGVGVVATQSFVDPNYGPLGLQLMRAGKSASDALQALLAVDENANVRQVAMIDANGDVANHTGQMSIDAHCEIAGDGFSVQANLMDQPTVCEAMFKAYSNGEGDLAERLMLAMEAAEAEGGDIRGKQSAAILVVNADRSLPPWGGRVIDLRVEDHADPLVEMRRLLTLARAYNLMNEGDAHMADNDIDAAVAAYSAAQAMVPDSHEMVFWQAVTLVGADRVDDALPLFEKAFAMWPQWRELVTRLPASGLLPDDPELIAKILSTD